MRKLEILMGVACLVALVGCDRSTAGDFTYKISADGAPAVADLNKYHALGDQTFRKTQRYQISVQGDGEKPFHFLVADVTMKLGSKTISSTKGMTLPITDGVYTFECEHFYDQKLSKSVEEADDPVCEIKPIGAIIPNASASISKIAK